VIVVGCKVDLRDENQPISLEPVMGPIMQQYREIETCIECSAVTLMQVFILWIEAIEFHSKQLHLRIY
jgi:Ras family protein T1